MAFSYLIFKVLDDMSRKALYTNSGCSEGWKCWVECDRGGAVQTGYRNSPRQPLVSGPYVARLRLAKNRTAGAMSAAVPSLPAGLPSRRAPASRRKIVGHVRLDKAGGDGRCK